MNERFPRQPARTAAPAPLRRVLSGASLGLGLAIMAALAIPTGLLMGLISLVWKLTDCLQASLTGME